MKNLFIGVAVGLVALSAVASALAAPPTQVTVCHHGSPLSVNASAVPAHLAHGDNLGACVAPPVDPPPVDPPGGGDTGGGTPPPVPQPAVLVTPEICSDGLPPDAGKDGWVSALGNSNDQCDHSGDPRLNNGVDTRTRW